MINITIVKQKQNILTIEATGHSGYDEKGKDIVCSAISTLTESLANGLTEIAKIDAQIVLDETIPHISITLPQNLTDEQLKNSQILMKSTYLGIKNVADGYPKFIKIKEIQHD